MKQFSSFFILFFLFLLLYFLFQGLTTQVWEGDSLAYHIPIAEHILRGQFSNFSSLLYYYPASTHVILAIFIFLGLPLQLFNVLGWLLLFVATQYAGKRAGLKSEFATIFAVVIVTLTSVIRLVLTQTIDIWMGVFFAWALGLLMLPQKNTRYFLLLGLALGMLAGTKFTGPLFVIALLVFFGRRVWRTGKISQIAAGLAIFCITGLPWYIRNFVLYSDPFYPASDPTFPMMRWQTWQTLFYFPGGLSLFIESLVSEYLFWSLLPLIIPVLLIKDKKRSIAFMVGALGMTNFIIHLLLPAAALNTLSDLRYAFPAFIALILSAFVYAQQHRKEMEITLIAVIPALSALTFVHHRPKIFFLFAVSVAIYYLVIHPWYHTYHAQKKL